MEEWYGMLHYWADLQSVHGFRCYDNTREREMSASACTRFMPGCFGLDSTVLALLTSPYVGRVAT